MTEPVGEVVREGVNEHGVEYNIVHNPEYPSTNNHQAFGKYENPPAVAVAGCEAWFDDYFNGMMITTPMYKEGWTNISGVGGEDLAVGLAESTKKQRVRSKWGQTLSAVLIKYASQSALDEYGV